MPAETQPESTPKPAEKPSETANSAPKPKENVVTITIHPRKLPGPPPGPVGEAFDVTLPWPDIGTELLHIYPEVARDYSIVQVLDENDEIIGLTIPKLSEIPIARKFRLMDGDVLMRLNGREINTVDDVIDIFSADPLPMVYYAEILRRDVVIQITYRLVVP